MEEDWNPPEVSHYGSAITSLDQLEELKEAHSLQKLRVLHCPSLTSMAGVEHLTSLTDLNLSSNAIQRIEGLHSLANLRVLNLSCNQIRVINGLTGLSTLEKLVLSFNKISSLKNLSQLYEFGALRVLDMRANTVNQVSELEFLAGLKGLQDVAFKGKTGTNGVCRSPQYVPTVLRVCRDLKFLDQRPTSELEEVENPVPQFEKSQPRPDKSPQRTRATVKPAKIENDYKGEILRLQQENERMYRDVKDLIHKYESNDKYWADRYSRIESEASELADALKSAIHDRKLAEKEADRLKEALDNCKEELSRVRDSKDYRDKSKDELQGHLSNVMRELGDAQRSVQVGIDENKKLREKLAALDRNNGELKAQLKQSEGLLTAINSRALDSSAQALQRYEELQHKYESVATRLAEREQEAAELKAKNQEILELNSKFDENWTTKYRDGIYAKDLVIESLKRELKNSIEDEQRKAEDRVRAEREACQKLVKQAEERAQVALSEEREKAKDIAVVSEDLRRQNVDLKEMLKLAVEKEVRGRGYIADLTDVVTQLQQEIDRTRAEHAAEISHWEAKSRQQLSEIDSLTVKYGRLTSKTETVSKEAEEIDEMLSEKTREISRLKREINDLKGALQDDEESLKQLKGKIARDEVLHAQEVSDLQDELRELTLTLGTKNALLDDQAEAIKELKLSLKASERDLEELSSAKSHYKKSYEDRLQAAYDEAENYKAKLDKQDAVIQEIDEQIEELTRQHQQDKASIAELQKQLADKNEALEYIEGEIQSMQDAFNSKSRREVEERDRMISDLKGFRDELNLSLIAKDRENKELQKSLRERDELRERLTWDLQKATEKNVEMEGELSRLVQVLETQRREGAAALQAISKIYSINP